jgi:aminoglycoside phosphotransferase family enzyme
MRKPERSDSAAPIESRFPTSRKVGFLSRPSSYPDSPARVDVIETHMSHVFLTDSLVYKLKKPIKTELVDLTTPQARYRNCREELRLIRFYRSEPPLRLRPSEHRRSLEEDLRATGRELEPPENRLSFQEVRSTIERQIEVLEADAGMFDRRVRGNRIVEGHGDLRPEHVCLRPRVAVIDCLEFNRSLRILDPVDELAYLSLECERLGAAGTGDWVLEAYCDIAKDRPPRRLIHFYKAYRASLRAKIAVRHTKQPGEKGVRHWLARAGTYLRLARKYLP